MATDVAAINGSQQYILPANVVNLTISGTLSTVVGNTLSNLVIAQGSNALTIDGQGGNDVVVCNSGADTIVEHTGYGHQVVYNFNVATDSIRLPDFGVTSFAALQSAMAQVGSDVVITLNDQDSVILRSTTLSSLTADDFELPIDLSTKKLTFDDVFDSFTSSPDGSSGWMTTLPYAGASARNNGGVEYYSDSSVGVNPFSDSNGVLTISASPATPGVDTPANSGLTYTSGILTTYKSFSELYGYFEIRAKLPTTSGFWPAFWLLPADNSWPPELDVVEMMGKPTAVETSHTSVGGYNLMTNFADYVPDASTTYHTYGVDWEKDKITWYIDDVAVASTATQSDMNRAMYMLVSLGVGGAAGSASGSASMQVEDVRVYASGASVINVSAAQFVNQQALLNGTPFSITDTVANITNALDAITADAPNITSVTATYGSVAVSTATFLSDQAGLDLISGGFSVFDSASSLAASLDQLSDTHLTQIVDVSGVPLVLTAAQVANDQSIIAKIVNPDGSPAQVYISGTASNVATFLKTYPASSAIGSTAAKVSVIDTQANETYNLDRLNDSRITAIVDTTNHPIVATAAQVTQDAVALSKIKYQNGANYSITVADTAANVEGQLSAIAANSHINLIQISSGAFTAGAVSNWASILNKIQGGFAVCDTAANIVANVSQLHADTYYITSMATTDGLTPVVSAYQFGWHHDVLDKIVGGYALLDTAYNIAWNAGSIQNELSHITAINTTDGPPSISVTRFLTCQSLFDRLTGGVALSDSAANVVANLDAIQAGLADVVKITLSGSSVVLTGAQAAAYAQTLAKIVVASGSTSPISVTDTAANIASALASPTVGSLPVVFKVVDTAANISANLNALSDSRVNSITDADNQPISETVGQLTTAASAFAKLQYQNGSSYRIAVTDTAAAIQAGIATLASNWRVSSITTSDTTPVFATAQLSTSAAALYRISGGFNIADKAASLTAALSTLQTFPTIRTIAATDGATPTASDATFAKYKGVLDKISGGFAISDTGATIAYDSTALAKDAHITALTPTDAPPAISVTRFLTYQSLFDKVTGGVTVSDSAANVTASLDSIQADVQHVASIAFTNGSPPVINLSSAQASSDAAALAKITSSYTAIVLNPNGSRNLTSYGSVSSVVAVGGQETLTGVSGETFVFNGGFGQAEIKSFAKDISGPGHQSVSLPSTEFANFAAVLAAAQSSPNGTTITAANGDSLTLDGVSLSQLSAASGNFTFRA